MLFKIAVVLFRNYKVSKNIIPLQTFQFSTVYTCNLRCQNVVTECAEMQHVLSTFFTLPLYFVLFSTNVSALSKVCNDIVWSSNFSATEIQFFQMYILLIGVAIEEKYI